MTQNYRGFVIRDRVYGTVYVERNGQLLGWCRSTAFAKQFIDGILRREANAQRRTV